MKDSKAGASHDVSSTQKILSVPETPENAERVLGTVSGESLSEDSRMRVPGGGLSRLRALLSLPAVRVWLPVLGKGLGTVFVLSCVAALGHQSREEEKYGQLVEPHAEKPLPVAEREADSLPKVAAQVAAPVCPVPPPCADQEEPGPSGITSDGLVILNEANADELTELPGVGKSRAEKIVALRLRLKGFRKVSDLLRIRGIGWRTLQKMKDKVVLNRPEPQSAVEGGDSEEKPG